MCLKFIVFALVFLSSTSFAESNIVDLCEKDEYAHAYKNLIKEYINERNTLLDALKKHNCFPDRENKNCAHSEIIAPTVFFQKRYKNIRMKYQIVNTEFGVCYPSLVGIEDSPFNKPFLAK